MIRVTRLNGKQYILNSDLIKYVEETPDTMITLTTNDKLMIQESVEYVVSAAMAYRQSVMHESPPAAAGVLAAPGFARSPGEG